MRAAVRQRNGFGLVVPHIRLLARAPQLVIESSTHTNDYQVADNEAHHHAEKRRQGDQKGSASSVPVRFAECGPAAGETDDFCNECNGEQQRAAQQIGALRCKERPIIFRRVVLANRCPASRSEATDANRKEHGRCKQESNPKVAQ